MSFPISVMRIEDKIVLIQGYMDEEFINRLFTIGRPYGSIIVSAGNPELREKTIFINGTSRRDNYRMVSRHFDEQTLRNYEQAIIYYKAAMGYEN